MLPQITTIVAEIDNEGKLTGAAYETGAGRADIDVPYKKYTTYGTWDAFRSACEAEDGEHKQLEEPES